MRIAKTDPATVPLADLKEVLNILKPVASPYELIRIGGNRDGAYLLPDDLNGIAACFSPGVNNFKYFEDELEEKYGISSYMCDFSSDVEKFKTPLREGKQFFIKKWLDVNGCSDAISLEQWVLKNCPDAYDDLILQMDIEGAEYRNILGTPSTILSRFRVMVFEIHFLNRIRNYDFFHNQLQPFLLKLAEHFVCIHARPNNVAPDISIPELDLNLPALMELTLLRKDRISQSRNQFIKPMLPHPQDIRRNVISKPPLFLNETWTDGERHPLAAKKMVTDLLDYVSSQQKAHDSAMIQLNRTMHSCCQTLYCQLVPSSPDFSRDNGVHNIAEGKPYWLSRGYGNYPPKGIVQDKSPFFFHTSFDYNSFITIDLGTTHNIFEIALKNRTDSCKERASALFFKLHQMPSHINASPLPVCIDDNFISSSSNAECRTPVPNLSARYVTILTFVNTALHLSSIQIMGTPRESGA